MTCAANTGRSFSSRTHSSSSAHVWQRSAGPLRVLGSGRLPARRADGPAGSNRWSRTACGPRTSASGPDTLGIRRPARLSGSRGHPRPYACRPPSASAVCGRASLPWRLLRSVIDSVGAASAEFPTEYLLLKPRAVGSPREYRSSNSARLPLAGRYLRAHRPVASGASSSVNASSLGERHRGGRVCRFSQSVRKGSTRRDLGRA